MTITEFVLARVAEDEEAARAAYQGQWREHDAFVYTGTDSDDEPTVYINGGLYANQRRTALHIARHDPARVLAECEAKRRIVELHEPGGGAWCTSACESESPAGCDTLRALAAIWSDHDDHDEAWR